MRQPVTADNLQVFMKALAAVVSTPSRIYLVGGATSVLLGWRTSTIDIDLKIVPESDEILRSLPELKERLQVNIELASPGDFIPELPGWQERSRFIQQEGKLAFYHYDFYAQALAKIERGHQIDSQDVGQLITNGLVDPKRLLELFFAIEDRLYLYPSLDKAGFRRAVERVSGAQTDRVDES
ncbi:MAG TPA: DUF6036 family nucleotidyltransferase [Pyrinomonadaceae bacterium]|nr:DUF6036 family nucleotidyltransferase [Pyrinomonadaceae bacterium]